MEVERGLCLRCVARGDEDFAFGARSIGGLFGRSPYTSELAKAIDADVAATFTLAVLNLAKARETLAHSQRSN